MQISERYSLQPYTLFQIFVSEVTTGNWCDRKYWFTCEQFLWEETLNNDDTSGRLYEMCKFSYLHKCRYPLECNSSDRRVRGAQKIHYIIIYWSRSVLFPGLVPQTTVKYFALWATISQLQGMVVLVMCIYVYILYFEVVYIRGRLRFVLSHFMLF